MTIAKLKKLVLLGDLQAKPEILEAIQKSGIVHLVPLTEYKNESPATRYEKLKEALTYLNNAPQKRRPQTPDTEFQLKQLIKEVLANKRARIATIDEIELIKERRLDLRPWGNFDYPELSDLSGYRFWFYKVPISKKDLLKTVTLPWKVLGEDYNNQFVVVVSQKEPGSADVPFDRVHVGSRSLSQLKKDLNNALVKLEDLNAERESLTRWIRPLTRSLDETINLGRMNRASGLTLDAEQCFALSGWVPESSLSKLKALQKALPLAYVLADPDENDNPPTLLENSDLFGGGQTAVSFFQLPGYQSWDPSIMIFFSFSLFFSIILADAGYALILGGFLGLYWKKMGRSHLGTRLRNLASAIIVGSTIYGVLIGSYFGIELDEHGILNKMKILEINDFMTMMQLTIGIGVLHLIAAIAIAGWRKRRSLIGLSSLGWIMVIGGAFSLWLQFLRTEEALDYYSVSGFIPGLGLLLVLLFSSDRKINSLSDLLLRVVDSVLAVYKLTKAFGDVLSYMRLFALGLSSASLAVTFNQLAISASESVPAGGFVLFILIVLFGHTLNFILAIMGGVIHGLRLNMLEFYNWGIEGEGYPFEAFKRN